MVFHGESTAGGPFLIADAAIVAEGAVVGVIVVVIVAADVELV